MIKRARQFFSRLLQRRRPEPGRDDEALSPERPPAGYRPHLSPRGEVMGWSRGLSKSEWEDELARREVRRRGSWLDR